MEGIAALAERGSGPELGARSNEAGLTEGVGLADGAGLADGRRGSRTGAWPKRTWITG